MSDDTVYTHDTPPELVGKTFKYIYDNHPQIIEWAMGVPDNGQSQHKPGPASMRVISRRLLSPWSEAVLYGQLLK
eukprot:42897-Eustigmatos_ZCMA.PRE.1